MTYAVILAARMGSSRLPGKALADYGAGPILRTVIDRWRMSDRNPTMVFTTTDNREDDPLAQLAHDRGIPVSRGDARNVVAQMDAAVKRHAPNARYVARALADNPLVDVGLADWRLDVLAETGADGLWYGVSVEWINKKPVNFANHTRITYAATTDIWRRDAWDAIVGNSLGTSTVSKLDYREHPGLWYWEHLQDFHPHQLDMPRREYQAPVRTELDTELDLKLFAALWRAWDSPLPMPTLWAMKYLENNPDVAAINASVELKTQSAPAFPNWHKPWTCDNCHERIGSIVEGNVRIICNKCGSNKTRYAHKPARVAWAAS